ncbi:MAG: hypothetical protein ACKO2Z_16045, partial [Sphaerospermopsis kisseleviana]
NSKFKIQNKLILPPQYKIPQIDEEVYTRCICERLNAYGKILNLFPIPNSQFSNKIKKAADFSNPQI